MEAHAAQNGVHAVNPRKRRRRRRVDRPAVSGHVLVDERLTGEVGVLSEDLFEHLFGKGKGKGAGRDCSILVSWEGSWR